MQQLQFIQPWLPLMVVSLIGIQLILIIVLIVQGTKLSGLKKRYKKFMNGLNQKSMEELLMHHIDIVNKVDASVQEMKKDVYNINSRLQGSVQKVGIIRYCAFEDIGSDLSFAIALLDEKDTGIIINGIYGRSSTYTYAKPIVEGQSTYKLSHEEEEALQRAKQSYMQRNE